MMPNILKRQHIEYFFIVAIIITRFIDSTANISYLLLAFYSFFGYKSIIKALFLVWFFTMGNPAYIPDASFSSAGRFLVITTAFIALTYHGKFNLKINNFTIITLAFGLFILIHSLLFSPLKDVSLLKMTLWVVATLTLTQAWLKLSANDQKKYSTFFSFH